MLSCEGIGKNIEQAINNALLELKASREDVDIKILDEGGFFRKAKVLVTISEDAVEKYEKRQENRAKEQEQTVAIEVKDEPIYTKDEDVEEPVDQIVSNKKEKTRIPDVDNAKKFVSGLLEVAGINADITSQENENEVFLNLVGASDVIGFRGEGINALQYLTSVYVGKNNRHAKKIRIDSDNYRAKREDTLIALAHRMARKVAKTNHSVRLEPMMANERRIIHSALSDDKYVETFSKGEEPYRYLTIVPKGQAPKTSYETKSKQEAGEASQEYEILEQSEE